MGFARVFIDLLNENDNRPIFSQALYNISLLESTAPGTSLLQIKVNTSLIPGVLDLHDVACNIGNVGNYAFSDVEYVDRIEEYSHKIDFTV